MSDLKTHYSNRELHVSLLNQLNTAIKHKMWVNKTVTDLFTIMYKCSWKRHNTEMWLYSPVTHSYMNVRIYFLCKIYTLG